MRGQALYWGQLDGQRGSQRTEISGLEEPTGLDRRAVEGPQEERGQNQGGGNAVLFRDPQGAGGRGVGSGELGLEGVRLLRGRARPQRIPPVLSTASSPSSSLAPQVPSMLCNRASHTVLCA